MSWPSPGTPNTVSTTAAPDKAPMKLCPMTVTMFTSALRKACFPTRAASLTPLALAIRM